MPETIAPAPATPGESYYPQLDGLRALAVTAVFIGHLIPLARLQQIVGWGDMGVVLFFCLSGFLITGILLRIERAGERDGFGAIRSFYIRRALRIFPIYYLTIAIAVLVAYEPVTSHLLRLATYTLNVPGLPPTNNLGAVSHFWSLSVEEQFYLFWPVMVVFVPRPRLRSVILLLVFLSLTYKLTLAVVGAPYKLVFASLWGCLDSLGLGAWLALTWHESGRRAGGMDRFVTAGRFFGILWVLLTTVRLVLNLDANYQGYLWFGVVYFAVAAAAFTGLIAFAVGGTQGPVGRFLGHPLMVRIGRISYGLYVYHFFMRYILLWLVSRQYIHLTSQWQYGGLSVGLSVLTAVLSWRFIERPILGLKRYFPVGITP